MMNLYGTDLPGPSPDLVGQCKGKPSSMDFIATYPQPLFLLYRSNRATTRRD